MGVIGKLAGQTIFITGASRGIGQAIALRCARDGANIVIAAKTTVPHPKLPGTIYTAAKEIEEAGGQCLPCVVDIQSEDQVKQAVDDTVNRFGGIDILVNNASAIHITDTLSTPMKRYDLMHHINTRGTFLCSKYCVPHLKKSSNPHILNISPPLSMQARWFKEHVAYTMAKFGMSMCALGMAEEFRDDGIAVNTLWPQTAIYTAAMAMLGGGDAVKSQCRSPDIMSDAAHAILTKPSRSYTGQFLVDETVLRGEGITDFDQYAYEKDATLLPDFFLEEVQVSMYDSIKESMPFNKSEASKSDSGSSISTGNADLDKALTTIQTMINPEMVGNIKGIFKLDLKDGGVWYLNLKEGSGSLGQDEIESGCQLTLNPDVFLQMVAGSVNPTTAFMTGKLKIKGDLPLATKLEKVLKQARSKL